MSLEPKNRVFQLLRDMRSDMSNMRGDMATKTDIADIRSEMHSLRTDVAFDLLTLRKDLSEQIVGLRRAVGEYHTSVIAHGVIISEQETRPRRIEQHLDLPPLDAH